jgi:DNA-binding MarR family transcriptional regulator
MAPTTLDTTVKWRIGRAWRELRRGASAIRVKDVFYSVGEESLDMALADALSVVCQQGPMRMGELAEALHITPASTTRAVACLADKGYVKRTKSAEDQRSIVVSATDAGQVRYGVIADRLRFGIEKILGEFSASEQKQLADMMERFLHAIDDFVLDFEDTASADTPHANETS